MNIERYTQRAASKFTVNGNSMGRLDTWVLLELVTKKDRSWLLAHPEYELTETEYKYAESLVDRRSKHEPLSYILGVKEFYGREFAVNHHTLQPRPETEIMIDVLLQIWKPELSRLIDVGTGSGALGITAALEIGAINVDLVDIDEEALEVARRNCEKHELNIRCFKSDLLENTESSYDIVLANLPYVPEGHYINKDAEHEPPHALFGGKDGLDLYRRMFEQLAGNEVTQYVLTESLPFQHQELTRIAVENGYKQAQVDDLIQVFSR